MHMSKHHEHALIFLGITICAGFLLSAPVLAGSGQGLTALESGKLIPFSFYELLVAENESAPFDISMLLDDGDAPDAVPTLPDEANLSVTVPAPPGEGNSSGPLLTGIFGALAGTDGEQAMPAETDNTTRPVAPAPAVDRSSDVTGSYDDERLAGLIDTASIRLMRLSMEHAHALYLQDADAAAVAADDLHALSVRMLGEVQPLQVSPEQQPVKDEFVRSLGAYSTASETLLDPTDTARDGVSTAFRDLSLASESLERVSQQSITTQPASSGVPASDQIAATRSLEAPAVPAGADPVSAEPAPEVLPFGERYTYDDPSGENMISLLAESTRTVAAYQEAPANASTAQVEAGEGHTFLLVVVKSTNLGHKGDSDYYAVETPGRDAFVLDYQGRAFTPLEVPSLTLFGDSFEKKTLERYESQKGYLYFDVPASINLSEATLRADLGSAGTPAWDLGREFGEEPIDAV